MTLLIEAETGNIAQVQKLLDEGADPNIKNSIEETALMWASLNGHTSIVKLLLNSGADPNIQDTYRSTALIWASSYDIVKLLLNSGANPNIQNNNEDTALMWAANYGHIDIIELLLTSGANPNIRDNDGFMCVSYIGNTGIRNLLTRHINIIKIQSKFRGIQIRHKARTQKAYQQRSAAQVPFDYFASGMIGKHLENMPYNPDVARRMRDEDENERMADYLGTVKQYGGRKKRSYRRRKRYY